MKKMIRITALVAVIMAMALCIIGCSGNTENVTSDPQAVCYVYAKRNNERVINVNSLRSSVRDVIKSEGLVAVVCCDGKPEIIAADYYEFDDANVGAEQSLIDEDIDNLTAQKLSEMKGVTANDPEVDVLAALRLALRAFSTLPAEIPKKIVVIDSGISTCGDLDFRNNILSADPATVVDELQKRKAIPDFTGIVVEWYQMGDTVLPQEPLTESQKARLEELWEAIITSGGGVFVPNYAPYSDETISSDLPAVSPVTLPAEMPMEMPIWFDPETLSGDDAFQSPMFLTEQMIEFIGDSDQPRHPDKAIAVVSPIAEYMKSHNDITLLLVGTTAGDENGQYNLDLSQRRADTIKKMMVSQGVSEERLITKGMGSADPWHVYGVGTKGELAAQNRKVVLIDYYSDTAQELLAQ